MILGRRKKKSFLANFLEDMKLEWVEMADYSLLMRKKIFQKKLLTLHGFLKIYWNLKWCEYDQKVFREGLLFFSVELLNQRPFNLFKTRIITAVEVSVSFIGRIFWPLRFYATILIRDTIRYSQFLLHSFTILRMLYVMQLYMKLPEQ